MSLSMNQFNLIPIKGQLDQNINPNVFSCRVGQSQATSLVPGQAVTYANTTSKIPEVLAATATDPIFGFVPYSIKKNTFAAGEAIDVVIDGGVMYMEADAAIAQGAEVEIIASGQTVTTALGTNTKVGIAFDKAAADDIFRVLIKTPQLTALST